MLQSLQIRAARGALKISALELAEITELNIATIQKLENSQKALEKASMKTIIKIKNALEERGVKFLKIKKNNGIIVGVGLRFDLDEDEVEL